jgi:hypothetical protein
MATACQQTQERSCDPQGAFCRCRPHKSFVAFAVVAVAAVGTAVDVVAADYFVPRSRNQTANSEEHLCPCSECLAVSVEFVL